MLRRVGSVGEGPGWAVGVASRLQSAPTGWGCRVDVRPMGGVVTPAVAVGIG